MKLVDVASYFDRTPVTDPITGVQLFLAQIDNFDDARRDASAAYRRILSVRPGTIVPGVIKLMNIVWLVGAMEPDGLEELHRQKYVIQRATDTLKVSSLSAFLAGTYASIHWSSPNWVKDAKQLETSSETPQIYDVALPSNASVAAQTILWATGSAYLVLAPHPVASGLILATCLKLEQSAPVVVNIQTRTYNPVTGTYSTPAGSSINALRVRWQSLFAYGSQASDRYQEGDVAIVLPTGTAATTNTLVTLLGATYQTLAVLNVAGAVVLHARLA